MTQSKPGYWYDDDEFLEILDRPDNDEWIGTAPISRIIECKMLTVNRRLFLLARDPETDVEVYDPKAGEVIDPDTVDDPPPRRQFGFRRSPVDPESAPASLETGYRYASDWMALRVGYDPMHGDSE